MIDGYRKNLCARIARIQKLKPMLGNTKKPTDPIGKQSDCVLFERFRALWQPKEGRAVTVGKDAQDPSWIDFARIRSARAEKGRGACHMILQKVLRDFPCVAKFGGTDRGVVPLRTLGIDRHECRLATERQLHIVFPENCFRAGSSMVHPA